MCITKDEGTKDRKDKMEEKDVGLHMYIEIDMRVKCKGIQYM